jgi:hypothetical protein
VKRRPQWRTKPPNLQAGLEPGQRKYAGLQRNRAGLDSSMRLRPNNTEHRPEEQGHATSRERIGFARAAVRWPLAVPADRTLSSVPLLERRMKEC